MLESTTPPGAEQGRDDLAAFLGSMADAYFRQCREAVKEIDPEGLYLGCRFAGWSHAVVFRTAAKYSDVISVNRYTETLADLRLPDGIDKPVVIGELHFGALDRGKFHASLRPVANQQARGEAYEKYVAQRAGEPAGRRHPLAPVRRPGHHRPRRRREFPERLCRRLRHALRRDDRRLPPDRLPAVRGAGGASGAAFRWRENADSEVAHGMGSGLQNSILAEQGRSTWLDFPSAKIEFCKPDPNAQTVTS